MAEQNLQVKWIDRGREPKCPPNPAYPKGKPIDCTGGAEHFCQTDLPCPAKRCGLWYVECEACGANALITTAGRPDDPCSVKLPCKVVKLNA
jgi:hypothetical protein